jgi:putative transposase
MMSRGLDQYTSEFNYKIINDPIYGCIGLSIMVQIKVIHKISGQTYGSRKITAALRRDGKVVNHKRVERLMREAGIRSKVARKFKATTNSKHSLPVAENILNREFSADRPNQKMVSDITYLWTDEGWLYIAAVMDLYGQLIVGLSMGERMTKELVINALESTWLRSGRPSGVLLHSDRGSQYCSHDCR